ncbi:MAG: hypothetical protein AB8B65_20670 [Kordia sp.]|uniref:hypothetical protein n=1 Tax=Kordia sp. TaxID=1965332 RepID=UPI00385CC310
MEKRYLKELSEIKNQIDDLSQKIDKVEAEVIETKNEAKEAKKEASWAKTNGYTSTSSTLFLGLLIIVILAFSTNPTFKEHLNYLKNRTKIDKDKAYEAKKAYKSYYLFSVIDSLGSDREGKMISFGIFGNVFEVNKP